MQSKRNLSAAYIELVQEINQDQFCLHQGQILPNATFGTCGKWNETVGFSRVGSFHCPTVRIENLGIFVVFRVVHETNDVCSNKHTPRNFVGTDLCVFSGHSGENTSSGRPHSQALVQEGGSKLELLNERIITDRFSQVMEFKSRILALISSIILCLY